MTKKVKFLYTAFRVFRDILDNVPTMTGCYQWKEVFKGDAKNYAELTDQDLENYDVIMVNLDGQDCRMITDLKRRLGNSSSTKIIANQDYAPEGITSGFQLYEDLKNGIMLADGVFATSPSGQGVFELIAEGKKKIHLIPHPCETTALKHINSFIENDWVACFYHRYGQDSITPYIALQNSGFKYGLIGHYEGGDKWFKRTQSMWPVTIPYLRFMDSIKLMKEAKYGLFVPNSYTYGRVPCDFACVDRPLVASKNIWSAQICYPLTLVDPFDVKGMRALLYKLRDNPTFYADVCNIAYQNVEFFSHFNSKNRFLQMLEEVD